MKKHVSLIFAGVLGGAISLGAYSLLFQKIHTSLETKQNLQWLPPILVMLQP